MIKHCFLLLGASALVAFAQLGAVDSDRLQSVVSAQSGVLLRIKSVTDVPASAVQPSSTTSSGATSDAEAKPEGRVEASTSSVPDKPVTVLRLGTGFFVSGDGLIVTNATVVHDAKRVWYEVDGQPYLAELVGYDVSTNLALLRAKTMPPHVVSVNLSDSVSLPALGTMLVRMSLPMDFGPTPSVGIVQGLETQIGEKAFPTRYLRVQLSSGPGEAGSPLFDTQGRFVGMTVSVMPEIGATFVIPARAIAWVKDALLAGAGKMSYPYFGFFADEDRSSGILQLIVKGVEANSPAVSSGLKVDDVIVAVAKKPCNNRSDLRDAAFFTKPGQYLDLTVRRSGTDVPIAIQAQGK
jgi:serine protease Do